MLTKTSATGNGGTSVIDEPRGGVADPVKPADEKSASKGRSQAKKGLTIFLDGQFVPESEAKVFSSASGTEMARARSAFAVSFRCFIMISKWVAPSNGVSPAMAS